MFDYGVVSDSESRIFLKYEIINVLFTAIHLQSSRVRRAVRVFVCVSVVALALVLFSQQSCCLALIRFRKFH